MRRAAVVLVLAACTTGGDGLRVVIHACGGIDNVRELWQDYKATRAECTDGSLVGYDEETGQTTTKRRDTQTRKYTPGTKGPG